VTNRVPCHVERKSTQNFTSVRKLSDKRTTHRFLKGSTNFIKSQIHLMYANLPLTACTSQESLLANFCISPTCADLTSHRVFVRSRISTCFGCVTCTSIAIESSSKPSYSPTCVGSTHFSTFSINFHSARRSRYVFCSHLAFCKVDVISNVSSIYVHSAISHTLHQF
jgi:hypothetical protein